MERNHVLRGMAAVLAAVVLVGLLGGCKKKTEADLVIVSPHNQKIEEEFERAFKDWYQEKYGEEVSLEWRDIGGTSDITKYLMNVYKDNQTSGIDVYFGGGAPDHRMLAEKDITVAAELDEEVVAGLPEDIGGVPQYDPAGRWYGAAASGFGIVYNVKLIHEHDLGVPKSWDDLADPIMYGRIAAANGNHSGSARAAYEMIVQSEPTWPEGWAKLLKIYANSKRYTQGASDIPKDVANGDILAGCAIDFYGYTQIQKSGEHMVGFSMPTETAAFTPDPISMLKGAPHPTVAKRFMEFVLSEEGQLLWCLPAGAEGGPKEHDLLRQPVRRDAYQAAQGRMLDPLIDPFTQGGGFTRNDESYRIRTSSLHGPLMQAAAIDNQQALAEAWKAIIDKGMPDDLMRQFTALPDNLADEQTALATAEKLSDPKTREKVLTDWQVYFRDKYKAIVEKAK